MYAVDLKLRKGHSRAGLTFHSRSSADSWRRALQRVLPGVESAQTVELAPGEAQAADSHSLWECAVTKDALAGTTTLRLNGQEYELRREPGAILLLPAHKPGEVYELRGGGSCSCPQSQFRKSGEVCKHWAAMRTLEIQIR